MLRAAETARGKEKRRRVVQEAAWIREERRGMVVDISIVVGVRGDEGCLCGRPHQCGHYERSRAARGIVVPGKSKSQKSVQEYPKVLLRNDLRRRNNGPNETEGRWFVNRARTIEVSCR
jgi:hypothetical protein